MRSESGNKRLRLDAGGYYMAMAARFIVAEPLTITGSIGVVTAKFNLENLYKRIGFSKEVISRGK